jgi:hypothetical protein
MKCGTRTAGPSSRFVILVLLTNGAMAEFPLPEMRLLDLVFTVSVAAVLASLRSEGFAETPAFPAIYSSCQCDGRHIGRLRLPPISRPTIHNGSRRMSVALEASALLIAGLVVTLYLGVVVAVMVGAFRR